MFGKLEILKSLTDVYDVLDERLAKADIPDINLNMSQKKLILHIVSKIDDISEPFDYVGILFDDFCNLFNIKNDESVFENVKAEIDEMRKKMFLLPVAPPRKLCRWLDDGFIDYGKNTVYFKLSNSFRPYYKVLKKQMSS